LDDFEIVMKTNLYSNYAEWCKESGLRHLSKIRFYNQIMSDFPMITETKPKGGGKREFRGIGLKFED
jgi:hypothetical protein